MGPHGISESASHHSRPLLVRHPDKVMFPGEGLTKADLAEYYERVAPLMLPHVRGRIVTMHRFPDGIEGDGFWQKRLPESHPEELRSEVVRKAGGRLEELVVTDTRSLRYLVDLGCITPHVWLSRVPAIDDPDRLIIDLDPPHSDADADFADVRWAARRVRELLEELGLRSWVMTTGSRGLHVVVPIAAQRSFDTVRHIAQGIATVARNRYPEQLTTAHRKAARGQRVLLDIWRNAYAQTAVAPYAVRAIPGAPVATPLAWRELDRPGLNAHRYTVGNLFRRLAQIDDPWVELGACAQSLDAPSERLAQLLEREGAYYA